MKVVQVAEEHIKLKISKDIKTRARVEDWGESALVVLEHGGQALVPFEELCSLARRFNLVYENYECEEEEE